MNKKLRLLVTAKCVTTSALCAATTQFDFEKIPVVDRLDYDEISISGGDLFCRIATERQCGLLTESETYSVRSESQRQDFSSIRHGLITEHSAIAAMTSTESVSRSTASSMW